MAKLSNLWAHILYLTSYKHINNGQLPLRFQLLYRRQRVKTCLISWMHATSKLTILFIFYAFLLPLGVRRVVWDGGCALLARNCVFLTYVKCASKSKNEYWIWLFWLKKHQFTVISVLFRWKERKWTHRLHACSAQACCEVWFWCFLVETSVVDVLLTLDCVITIACNICCASTDSLLCRL